MTEHVEQIFCK